MTADALGYVLGGQTQIPKANVSYVIERACEANRQEILPGFLSHNGRDALGLPRSSTTTSFTRYDWSVEETVGRVSSKLGKLNARVAMAGQARKYLPTAQLTP